MYEALVARVRYHIQKANFMGLKDAKSTLLLAEAADAIEELQAGEKKLLRNISALETENENLKRAMRWIPVADIEHLPNTDSRVVGYFSGGAFDQLRWYDFVWTESDGTLVSENREREVMNEHCIAVFKLPEPSKEET